MKRCALEEIVSENIGESRKQAKKKLNNISVQVYCTLALLWMVKLLKKVKWFFVAYPFLFSKRSQNSKWWELEIAMPKWFSSKHHLFNFRICNVLCLFRKKDFQTWLGCSHRSRPACVVVGSSVRIAQPCYSDEGPWGT